jgi:hypothetical protein
MRSSTTPSSGRIEAHGEAVALPLVDHALDVLGDLLGGAPVRLGGLEGGGVCRAKRGCTRRALWRVAAWARG